MKPALVQPVISTNVGMAPRAVVCDVPSTLEITEPMPGRPPIFRKSLSDQPESDCVGACSSRMPATERTTENFLPIAASLGINSQISRPSEVVLIGWNSPRYSLGAVGLR